MSAQEVYHAAVVGDTAAARRLLAAGAPPEFKDAAHNGATTLHRAAWRGHVDIVKMLLDAGAPVDPRNNNGATPLMNAAMCGNSNIIAVLRAAGADVRAVANDGRTAIDHAGGRAELVAALQQQ
jgi:ankyrin repeat protein